MHSTLSSLPAPPPRTLGRYELTHIKSTIAPQTADEIDQEVKALVERAYRRAKDLVQSNIDILHKVANVLCEKVRSHTRSMCAPGGAVHAPGEGSWGGREAAGVPVRAYGTYLIRAGESAI